MSKFLPMSTVKLLEQRSWIRCYTFSFDYEMVGMLRLLTNVLVISNLFAPLAKFIKSPSQHLVTMSNKGSSESCVQPLRQQWHGGIAINKRDKVFKSGLGKICGRQSLKNFTWFILEYFVPNVMLSAIRYHLHIFKNMKNTHGRV